jgi:hypothetical protein
VILRNPCYKCIVRATCRQQCIYHDKFENDLIKLLLFTALSLGIFQQFILPIIIYTYICKSYILSVFIFISLWAISFYYSNKQLEIIDRQALKELKKKYHRADLYLAPFLVYASYLATRTRNYVKRPGGTVL